MFFDIAIPVIIELLIWIGLGMTIFSLFWGRKDIKGIKNKENENAKHIIMPLVILVVFTVVLTFFSR